MRKIMIIAMLVLLSLALVVGCAKKAEPVANTQTTATGSQNTAVDTQATQGISDASTTSKTLDTTQTDVTLGSANKSLASW